MYHGVPMRDLVADWKKWSRAERVIAVMGTLLMVALPLGIADDRLDRPGAPGPSGASRLAGAPSPERSAGDACGSNAGEQMPIVENGREDQAIPVVQIGQGVLD
jgi:hypothetical protein